MDTMTMKNEGLPQLVQYLQSNEARKRDVIVASDMLRYDSESTQLLLNDQAHEITEDGVTTQEVVIPHDVNIVAERQLRSRCDIPHSYWERMKAGHFDLLDENVNHWLGNDPRNLMLRTFTSEDSAPIVRAILSDRYRILDDLDVLMAALDGIRASGIVDPSALDIGCDYTGQRMYVKITAPEIAVAAQALTERYRDSRNGRNGMDYPMVFAGLVIANSETGHGTASITPRIVFQVCTNGMTRPQDVSKSVHLGGRLDEGVVKWSEDTQRKQLELIQAKTKDAVTSFLSEDYVTMVVREMQEVADVKITDHKRVVEVVSKKLGYTQERQEGLLLDFMAGGDYSALGIAQAITHVAQDQDPDTASEMEAQAWTAATIAAMA